MCHTPAPFLPLLFMTGIIGRFVKFIPLVVIVALLASLLEAFVILPSHLADFAKPRRKAPPDKARKEEKRNFILSFKVTEKLVVAKVWFQKIEKISNLLKLFCFHNLVVLPQYLTGTQANLLVFK